VRAGHGAGLLRQLAGDQAIGVDYLDMIMLDYPASDCPSIVGQWLAFEGMLKAGKTKSIAVSNFSPQQLDCIVSNKSMTVPAVNQMPYSVGDASQTVVADNAKRGGILVQAYSPLQSGGLANDPDCVAIGKSHQKSGAQVALKWILQHNASFTTSASSAAFFAEDIALFDFTLSAAEMKRLDAKGLLP
jgi:diketogulonate reductase-like aldo/keto reductase